MIPMIGQFFYDYTVFVGNEHFTVTEPNDMRFPDFFLRRVVALDEMPLVRLVRR